MTTYIAFDSTFGALFAVTILAALLTGSTLQWVVSKGLLSRGGCGCNFWKRNSSNSNRSNSNQYNIIVTVAAVSALIQTVTCFINTIIAPNHIFGFSVFIVANWVVMTHSSVMLVSRKLSLTYHDPEKAWHRLLLINAVMLPFSLFICVSWTMSQLTDSVVLQHINRIMEPIQIALWGLIEFCLSGMFIVKMWKFHWTKVEHRGIFVLVLVAICDIATVLLNLFIGDLESTCVKGFVYALRIRLEVSVLCTMVDFVNDKRRGIVTFGRSTRTTAASGSSNLMSGSGRQVIAPLEVTRNGGGSSISSARRGLQQASSSSPMIKNDVLSSHNHPPDGEDMVASRTDTSNTLSSQDGTAV